MTATRSVKSTSASCTPQRASRVAAAEGFGRAGDAGSLAHYENPEFYWRSYSRRRRDVAYYLRLAKSAKEVLEYGIGNGRIALPLARAGVSVTGIDLSRPMLRDLERRLGRTPRRVRESVQIRFGDMRSVRLGRRFPLVIAPFNAVLHLYSLRDVERFFARVREHLAPGGEFVFDILVPSAADLARAPAQAYRVPGIRDPETGQRLLYQERFHYDPMRQLLLVWSEFASGRRGAKWRVPLTQRQFFPCEMEALLCYNGFFEVRRIADFDEHAPCHAADSLVFRCRAGTRGRRGARVRNA